MASNTFGRFQPIMAIFGLINGYRSIVVVNFHDLELVKLLFGMGFRESFHDKPFSGQEIFIGVFGYDFFGRCPD